MDDAAPGCVGGRMGPAALAAAGAAAADAKSLYGCEVAAAEVEIL